MRHTSNPPAPFKKEKKHDARRSLAGWLGTHRPSHNLTFPFDEEMLASKAPSPSLSATRTRKSRKGKIKFRIEKKGRNNKVHARPNERELDCHFPVFLLG